MFSAVYGPPCSGKSTICRQVEALSGVFYINVGEITNREALKRSDVGDAILNNRVTRELFPPGFLVPLVRPILHESRERGVILDGYPKHMLELEEVIKLLEEVDSKLNIIFVIETPVTICQQRMSNRVTCAMCYASFRQDDVDTTTCPNCTAADSLMIRIDDNDKRFEARLNSYVSWTPPIIQALASHYAAEVIKVQGVDTSLAVSEILAGLRRHVRLD